MQQEPEQLEYSGFTCPVCGYDLRGLPKQVCPECGVVFELTDEEPFRWKPIAGIFAAMASMLIGLATTLMCIQSFHLYVNELGSWCGTGRCGALMTLMTEGPIGTILTWAMWLLARKVGHGQPATRFASVVTSITWIASLSIVISL